MHRMARSTVAPTTDGTPQVRRCSARTTEVKGRLVGRDGADRLEGRRRTSCLGIVAKNHGGTGGGGGTAATAAGPRRRLLLVEQTATCEKTGDTPTRLLTPRFPCASQTNTREPLATGATLYGPSKMEIGGAQRPRCWNREFVLPGKTYALHKINEEHHLLEVEVEDTRHPTGWKVKWKAPCVCFPNSGKLCMPSSKTTSKYEQLPLADVAFVLNGSGPPPFRFTYHNCILVALHHFGKEGTLDHADIVYYAMCIRAMDCTAIKKGVIDELGRGNKKEWDYVVMGTTTLTSSGQKSAIEIMQGQDELVKRLATITKETMVMHATEVCELDGEETTHEDAVTATEAADVTEATGVPEVVVAEAVATGADVPEVVSAEATATEAVATGADVPEVVSAEATATEAVATGADVPEVVVAEAVATEAVATGADVPEVVSAEATATEAVATEADVPEVVVAEAVATEAVATEAVATEVVVAEAVATEAVATEAVATEAEVVDWGALCTTVGEVLKKAMPNSNEVGRRVEDLLRDKYPDGIQHALVQDMDGAEAISKSIKDIFKRANAEVADEYKKLFHCYKTASVAVAALAETVKKIGDDCGADWGAVQKGAERLYHQAVKEDFNQILNDAYPDGLQQTIVLNPTLCDQIPHIVKKLREQAEKSATENTQLGIRREAAETAMRALGDEVPSTSAEPPQKRLCQ